MDGPIPIFDITKCNVPSLTTVTGRKLVQKCFIPPAPQVIHDCGQVGIIFIPPGVSSLGSMSSGQSLPCDPSTNKVALLGWTAFGPIPPRIGNKAGRGDLLLVTFDPITDILTITSQVETVRNLASMGVAANEYTMLKFTNCVYFVDFEDCPTG